MTRRKVTLALLALALLVMMLAGCGSDQTEEDEPNRTKPKPAGIFAVPSRTPLPQGCDDYAGVQAPACTEGRR